jgi:hypothetical protein
MNPLSRNPLQADTASPLPTGHDATAAAEILKLEAIIKTLSPDSGPTIAPHVSSRHAYVHHRQDGAQDAPAIQELAQDSEDGTDLVSQMAFNGSAWAEAKASGALQNCCVRAGLPPQAWGQYAAFLSESRHRDMVTLPAHSELTLSGHAKGAAALPGGADSPFVGALSAQVIVGLFGPIADQQQVYRNGASARPNELSVPFGEQFVLRYPNNTDQDITVEINLSAYVTGTVGNAPDDTRTLPPSPY